MLGFPLFSFGGLLVVASFGDYKVFLCYKVEDDIDDTWNDPGQGQARIWILRIEQRVRGMRDESGSWSDTDSLGGDLVEDCG